jgi:serine protease Do
MIRLPFALKRSLLILLIILAAPVMAQPLLPQPPETGRALPASFADLVERLSPAVVNISTTQKVKGGVQMFGMPFEGLPNTPEMEPFRDFFERFARPGDGDKELEREVYSLGSGFIIDAKGYVITNNHVIESAEEITVTLNDESQYKAKVLGRDKKTDLALLKIEPKKELPFVIIGDSDAMRVGDWVIAIGNPFGLGGSVTQGIISARQRSLNAGPFDDFLQTDAPINRGNSGGPLFNMRGEVIGITTAIFSTSGGSMGIGFAIPTALASPVISQLREYGRTHRGWLGVKIQEVSQEVAESVGLPKPIGALVLEVSPGSPAQKAGILTGDVITAFAGREITEMRFLPRMVAETKIGKTVDVTYWRKGQFKTVPVTLGELDETSDEASGEAPDGTKPKGERPAGEVVLGMQVAPLTPALREEFRIGEKTAGLAVVDVAHGSEAAKRGVRPGDVIVDVNGAPVKSAADLKKAFESARKAGRNFALVKIARSKEEAFITLPTSEEKKEEKKE